MMKKNPLKMLGNSLRYEISSKSIGSKEYYRYIKLKTVTLIQIHYQYLNEDRKYLMEMEDNAVQRLLFISGITHEKICQFNRITVINYEGFSSSYYIYLKDEEQANKLTRVFGNIPLYPV